MRRPMPPEQFEKARVGDVFGLFEDGRLSTDEIGLWLWYRKHHVGDGGAFVSDDRTAAVLRWSQSKLTRVRARLRETGFLHVVRRGPKPCGYVPVRRPKDSSSMTTLDSSLVTTQESSPMTGQACSSLTSLDSSPATSQAKDCSFDCSPVTSTKKDEPVNRKGGRLTPSQQLVNRVIEVGLFGVRPPNYGKQAKRADHLLAEHKLNDLLGAVDTLRGQFPYKDSSDTFDVFDLGKQAHKLVAKRRHQAGQGTAPHDNYLTPAQLREIEEGSLAGLR